MSENKSTFNRENNSNRIFYFTFLISFFAYLFTLHLRPYPLSYILKILPILSLIGIAYYNLFGKMRIIILAALFFSAIGDIILAFDGNTYFIFGLSAFAITHCLYIYTFLKTPTIFRKRSITAVIFIVFGLIMAKILVPILDKMLIPVLIYLSIITLMGISAVVGKNNNILLVVGAFLFIISDSIIAINMFHTKIPFSSFWIMITYFPAQFFITYGSYKS